MTPLIFLRLYPFYAYILFKIFLNRAFSTEFYLKNNHDCSNTGPLGCDGSIERPFPSLIFALRALESQIKETNASAILKLKDDLYVIPETLEKMMFFSSNSYINLTILPDNSSSKKTKIKFDSKSCFSLFVKAGCLGFESIDFEGNLIKTSLEYAAAEGSQTNYFSPGFINLEPESKTMLNFKNCTFSGIFFDLENKGHAFLALIYLNTFRNELPVPQTEILIDGLDVSNAHYPQGILYSNSFLDLNNQQLKLVNIKISNLKVTNYNNKNFLHWKSGVFFEKTTSNYFDFLLILNNTQLKIENLSITNSSRILLANKNNLVQISRIDILVPFDVQVTEKSPPEMIYLINSNIINVDGISIINTTMYSFDDMVEPNNRDLPFLNGSMIPASLLKLEKNQALFGLAFNNSATFSNINVKNCFFYKKDNFLFSLFGLEHKNKIVMTRLMIDFVTLDTESRIGILSVLHLAYANELHLINSSIVDLSVYGYSNVLFGNVMAGNYFNSSNVIYLRNYFKTKSNRGEVNNFLDGINTNPSLVFVNKSALIKSAGIFLMFVFNSYFADNTVANETLCLYGCLVGGFYKNTLTLNKLSAKQASSEVMSSVFALALGNVMKGEKLVLEECRANSGVIYARTSNFITLTESRLMLNWGMGGFGLRQFHVSGNLALSIENKLVLKNSLIANGYADITAGGIYLRERNTIDVDSCIFIENESSSATSTGGGIFSFLSNTVNIKNTAFNNNYGTFGGAIYGENLNSIQLENCTLEKNQGEQGAGIFLNGNNTIKVANCQFVSNQGFVRGGLIVISGINHIIQINTSKFIGNQAPFKGNLLEISEKNIIIIKGSLIDYDKTGNGNFLHLDKNNTLKAANISIVNIMNLEIFMYCDYKNDIDLSDTFIQNNEWKDSFIFSQNSNRIKISNFSIFNISVTETALGFLNAFYATNITIKNLSFQFVSGESNMIITANRMNTIIIESMFIADLKVISGGICFDIRSTNQVNFRNFQIKNFHGFSNDIFLFKISDENIINLEDLTTSGYFSLEQVWNFTCIIRIIGDNNLISIINSSTFSENPSFLKVESLSYFVLEGTLNSISIMNSVMTLKNYLSFFISEKKSYLILKNSHFKDCEVYGNLIVLKNKSTLSCEGSNFHTNILRKERSLFLIIDKVLAVLKKVTCNANNLFLVSIGAVYNISDSIFIYFKNKKLNYSTALLINEDFSLCFYESIEVLLRENKEDSIIIVVSSTVNIKYSSFGLNKALNGGVLRMSNQSSLFLYSNTFYGNEALLGGVLKFENISIVSMVKNYFFTNKAVNHLNKADSLGKGGCIYASIDSEQNFYKFDIKYNKFVLGGAEIGGILYFSERKSAEYFVNMNFLASNLIKSPKVRFYGIITASPPLDVKMIPGDDINIHPKENIKITNKIPFSAKLPSCLFQVISTDFFNQTALGENDFKALSINNNPDYTIDFSLHNSFLCFSSLRPASSSSLKSITQENLKITLNSSQLSNWSSLAEGKQLVAEIKIQKCQRGEYFDLVQLECLPCQANFFSFESEFTEPSSCKSCISESFYCYGGFNHTPKPGYWRRRSESINFIKCPNAEACLGDPNLNLNSYQMSIFSEDYSYSTPEGSCGLAYRGILCNKCRAGYAKAGGIRCSPCGEGFSIFLMVIKILLRIFLYYYTIYKAFMMCKKVKNNNLPQDLVYSNFLLKILISHFQFLKSFIGFPFMFPSMLKEIFNIFSFSISSGADKVLNLECFINFDLVPASYIYCVINIVAPLLIVTSIAAFIKDDDQVPNISESVSSKNMFTSITSVLSPAISPEFSKIRKQNYFLFKIRLLPYLFLISLMLSYDEVLSLLIHNFSYINVDDVESPDFRVVNDFEIEFFSPQHRSWVYFFAIPATMIIGILIPTFIIFNIFRAKRKGNLKKKTILLRFGYFFFAYDDNHFYYELIYITRKIFLIAMDSFFIKVLSLSHLYNPLTFLIVICFFYTGLSFFFIMNRPYKEDLYPSLNRIENFSVTIQALTAWIGCFIMSFNDDQNGNKKEIIYFLGFILTLSINMALFAAWGFYYLKFSIISKVRTALKSIKTQIYHGKSKKASSIIQNYEKKNTLRNIAKESSNLIEKKESLSLEDLSSIDEKDHRVYIPPHLSSRWSSMVHLKSSARTKQALNTGEFIIIRSPEVNPALGLSLMEYLWEKFDKFRVMETDIKFVNNLFSKWEKTNIINESKKLFIGRNKNSCLEICFDIQTQEELSVEEVTSLLSRKNKVYCSSSRYSAFLSSIDYEFNLSNGIISLKITVQINDIQNVSFLNKIQLNLVSESLETALISCSVDIFISDFIEINNDPMPMEDAFYQLLLQGVRYSSDSEIVNLKLPSENLFILVINQKI